MEKSLDSFFLSFEQDIVDLESQAEILRKLIDSSSQTDASSQDDIANQTADAPPSQDDISDLSLQLDKLEQKIATVTGKIYKNLLPWQKVLVARHHKRPHTRDFIHLLFDDFTSMAGDRCFGEDHAILAGLARFNGRGVVVMGHEKGHDTPTRVMHNFGMANPEGYRKVVRLLDLANRFSLPVITFIDTAGAYPGKDAEERGQAESIATSMKAFLELTVPVIAFVIGEGGSGGAIALGCANKVYMLEHAIYSVISPEGASSILWRDNEKSKEAAQQMSITAQDLLQLGVIDDIITEPVGAAHRNKELVIRSVGEKLNEALQELSDKADTQLRESRNKKFLDMVLWEN